jgi:hypothetical protein
MNARLSVVNGLEERMLEWIGSDSPDYVFVS